MLATSVRHVKPFAAALRVRLVARGVGSSSELTALLSSSGSGLSAIYAAVDFDVDEGKVVCS